MKKEFYLKRCRWSGVILSAASFCRYIWGTGKGFGGDIVLKAEITDNKLVAVEVVKEAESDFAKAAIKQISDKAIASQSLDVDDMARQQEQYVTKAALKKCNWKSGAVLTKVEAAKEEAKEISKKDRYSYHRWRRSWNNSCYRCSWKRCKSNIVRKNSIIRWKY